ncbi:MAG: DUF1573 domain-containing protein [Bacteroidales bacterium]|nr:DUF1573 domain-containing protein [Bacteroidales bacterium]
MITINKNIILIVILCSFLCSLSCSSRITQTEVNNSVYLEDLYISNILSANTFELPLNMIIRDSKGDTITFKEIIKESEKIVLRISNSFCSSCVDEELMRIGEFVKDSSVIILATYQNPRIIKVIEKKKSITNPIYYIEQSKASAFLTQNDMYGSPYYFIVDKRGKCSCVFFPSLDYKTITERYISYSLQRVKQNQKRSIFLSDIFYIDSAAIGDTITIPFEYVNIYNNPLKITHVENSCNCTNAQFSNSEIVPLEKDKIIVQYVPDAIGERILQLRIWHNQSIMPETITLYSNIDK